MPLLRHWSGFDAAVSFDFIRNVGLLSFLKLCNSGWGKAVAVEYNLNSKKKQSS